MDRRIDFADNRLCQESLIGPMRHIFGVSDKVLAMSLSSILMADRANRPQWLSHTTPLEKFVRSWRTNRAGELMSEVGGGLEVLAEGQNGAIDQDRLARFETSAVT